MTDREAVERTLERFWINDAATHGHIRPAARELIAVIAGVLFGGHTRKPLEDGTLVSDTNHDLVDEMRAALLGRPSKEEE